MTMANTTRLSCVCLFVTVALTVANPRLLAPAIGQAEPVKVTAAASVASTPPGSSFDVAVVLELREGYHINSHRPSMEELVATSVTWIAGKDLSSGDTVYPQGIERKFAFADKALSIYEGRVVLRTPVKVSLMAAPGQQTLGGNVKYQACSTSQCFPPKTVEVKVTFRIGAPGSAVVKANPEVFRQELKPSAAATAAVPGTALPEKPKSDYDYILRKKGVAFLLLAVFFGGLLLNLTPCVYPIIPITISYFGGQSEGRPTRTFLMACFYVAGMAITYSALGVAAALSGKLLGSALQNPWVLGFIVAVLLALAASMFGLYDFQLPSFLTGSAKARSGLVGALFMGLVVGLVAAPCIGPVISGLILFVANLGSPVQGFLLFFVLALGMGTPYLALGTFSGAIKRLPRSGEWMEQVKHVFGLALVALALHFARPLSAALDTVFPLFIAGSGIYLLAAAAGSAGSVFVGLRRTLGALVLTAGLLSLAGAGPKAHVAWEPYSSAALTQAAQRHQPVVVGFSAKWCVPCRIMERTVFGDPRVVGKLKRFVVMKADLTHSDSPEAKALTERYEVRGVPTIVFLDRDGAELKRLRIEREVTADEFLQQLERVPIAVDVPPAGPAEPGVPAPMR